MRGGWRSWGLRGDRGGERQLVRAAQRAPGRCAVLCFSCGSEVGGARFNELGFAS